MCHQPASYRPLGDSTVHGTGRYCRLYAIDITRFLMPKSYAEQTVASAQRSQKQFPKFDERSRSFLLRTASTGEQMREDSPWLPVYPGSRDSPRAVAARQFVETALPVAEICGKCAGGLPN